MNIYEIAQLAGCSVATVSKIINDKPGVAAETRERVCTIMEEYDYQPRISNNTYDVIALAYRSTGSEILTSEYTMQVMAGVVDILYEYGYSVILVPYNTIPKDPREFRLYCQRRRIGGMVALNLHKFNTELIALADMLPIVTVSSRFESPNMGSVVADNEQGAYDLIRFLIQQGHKRIGIFVPDTDIPDHALRLQGYARALREAGLPIKREYIIDNVGLRATDYLLQTQRLLNMGDEAPTALFACNDQEALTLCSVLKSMQISIPEQISVVGFDDYAYAVHATPALTTVRQPLYEMGKEAGRMVYCMGKGDMESELNCIMETQLIVRQSTISIK